jgi:hypothetical protein
MKKTIALLVLISLPMLAWSEEPDELEQLFRIDEVSEGQLRFLTSPAESGTNVHSHLNHITIRESSLHSGWVELQQCHTGIDAVSRAAVTYNPERIRKLQVITHDNIDAAWVEGANVELKGIQADALLCIRAETQAFSTDESGGFILRNGPYMRKFLDGYYPLRLELIIDYPAELITFSHSDPVHQEGFSIAARDGRIEINTLFEGRLMTRLYFEYRL